MTNDDRWYLEDVSDAVDSSSDDELPRSQRGHFVCTSQGEQFILFFDDGNVMLMQPGVTARFEDVYQVEEIGEENDG